MIIRLMKEEDLSYITILEQRLYKNPWDEKAFRDELTKNKFSYLFVLTENEAILGYYGLWIIGDYATVTKVSVMPELQNRGLGKILMEDLIKRCEAAEAVTIDLEVRESNYPAIALYHHFGFQSASVRKNYYPDGENAILMIKKLDKEESYERIHIGN